VLSKRPERVARVIDADEAYRRATIFLGGTAVRLLGTQSDFRQRFTSDTHMQNVIAHISEIQERVEQMTIPRTRLQLLIREMFSGPKEVRFSDNGIEIRAPGEKSIPLASLSSGEKQLLRILLEALTAEKNSIIVDEPEISMHVEWQRRLLNAMQTLNSGCQIVVATHSPEIMADVDDDKIFRL
jgi:predicted ATP-dependent endonuclease of OLD family